MRRIVTKTVIIIAIAFFAASCSGSSKADSSQADSSKTQSTEQPAPSGVSGPGPLPGDGEVVYASEDVMCLEEINTETGPVWVDCPEGTTNYWVMSDDTFIVDISNFDDDMKIEVRHDASLDMSATWTKPGGVGGFGAGETFQDMVTVDGDYVVIDIDLCAWGERWVQPDTFNSPSRYEYESLSVQFSYRFDEVTLPDGSKGKSGSSSLFHRFRTDTKLAGLDYITQPNRAAYDQIHNNAESCSDQIELPAPTFQYLSEDPSEYVGRPDA